MDVQERLKRAIDVGEVLTIRYLGGSQPGALREIAPKHLDDHLVYAYCYSSGADKEFSVGKIQFPEPADVASGPRWNKNAIHPPQVGSLSDYAAQQCLTLESLGWHVERTETSLSLHRRRKSGVPLKGSDVELVYEQYTSDGITYIGDERLQVNPRLRLRPYTLRAKGKTTESFGSVEQAAPTFLLYANELAPNRK